MREEVAIDGPPTERPMAGVHVPVLRKTTYSIQAGQNVILAQLVDAVGWKSGTLIVRVYSGAGIFSVKVYNAMLGPEDPSVILVEGNPMADISVQANPEELHTRAFPDPQGSDGIGRYVRVLLSSANGADVTLGVDLVGRSS